MRTEDLVVGETYIASIPQRLPEELRRPGDTPEQWRANMQLHLVRGRRVTVTVTGFGEEPNMVVVSRDVPAGRVALRLTTEQAAALDLAEGQEYEITGIITDADGQALTFPGTVAHTIPARWLRPAGEQLVLPPDTEHFHRALVCRDADGMTPPEGEQLVLPPDTEHFHRALVCRDADGMTPPEIDRAAEKALEQLQHVRGLALEDPNVDHSVLASEADHREWLRIAERVRAGGLAVYDPRTDPDAVEHPPLVRFREP
ncbi:hypothetical protein ACFVUY_42805 [Kitasatospora sp. NPDC058063]|uniref:hypothetical protein n=1 Tax=unclassified Kitasatospora TaxID=2633591 RepID=UPI0036DEFB8E